MRYIHVIMGVCFAASVPAGPLCAQEEESSPPVSVQEIPPDVMLQDGDSLQSVVEVPRKSSRLTWYSMFTNIPGDWASTGEAAFSSDGLPVMGGIALATGVLLIGDHPAYSFTHGLFTRSADFRYGSNLVLRAGDGKTTLGISAAFALYGFLGDDPRALRTASGTVEALLASGIAVQILKRISGRESPIVATRTNGTWRPFPAFKAYNRDQPRYYAFPSGHLTTAMATLTVIAENYPEAHWIRPVGYSIVGLTGVSLVSKGWHWYSDFPLAIALGYTFGRIAAHHDDDARGPDEIPGSQSTSLRVLPNIGPQGTGIMLALSF
jgi:membrane-associated phospholipid phosphatase